MSYKQIYIVPYWFDLADGSLKKGESSFEAADKLSPEFKFENIKALVKKPDRPFLIGQVAITSFDSQLCQTVEDGHTGGQNYKAKEWG